MFSGGGAGIGVGLSVAVVDAQADAEALAGLGPGARPARLSELFPPAERSDAALARELVTVDRLEAMLAAYKADMVVELGYRRPAARDVPYQRPGAPDPAAPVDEDGRPELIEVSEFCADELALILDRSRLQASTLLARSFTLRRALPRTWSALADGTLDWPRARGLAAELGGPAAAGTDPAILAAIEEALLPAAGEVSVRRLRELARRELLARDPDAADRRRAAAEKAADVQLRHAQDGAAELSVFTDAARGAAMHDAVDRYARMLRADGDPRPIGQLRVDVLEDLILRPWDTTREPVTATVTLFTPLTALTHMTNTTGPGTSVSTAPAGSAPAASATPVPPGVLGPPAEVNGQPITATQLRALLQQVDTLCPGGLQPPAGGVLRYALTDPDGTLRATVDDAELRRLARRGCPTHPEGDPTRPAGDCGCAVLDRPPEVDRYRPTPAQRRFVTTRDRTCRHPGCSNRAGWADLDHVLPHARGGPTACENLCCLCRRHHRLKTHARDWLFTMSDDGTLTVTTPSGVTRVTRPPGHINHALATTAATGLPDDAPPF